MMSEERKERCQTCRFWTGYDVDETHWQPETGSKNNVGVCKRFPPLPVVDPKRVSLDVGDYHNPLTYFDDWCGEWQAVGTKKSLVNPEILAQKIRDSAMSVRARKVMSRLGIETVGQLAEKSEMDLLETKGCGMTTLREIQEFLSACGLFLAR